MPEYRPFRIGSSQMGGNMINLTGIKKIYKSGKIYVEALKGIDLVIQDGEMIVLTGVSGSGKSTLLNLIGAMDSVTEGRIFIDEEDITNYSTGQLTNFRARHVGFIFQTFNLIPVLNVYENIVIPMALKGQAYKKEEVLRLIDQVGLSKYIKHRPDELSGGQRQRIAIARAIVHKPRYIMADEPTANLDSNTARTIIELLQDINEKMKVTIVFASHDKSIFEAIDKKIVLTDGLIVNN